MKISFNEATAKQCSSLEKDIALCARAGFQGIEIRIDMLRDALKRLSPAAILELLGQKGLEPLHLNAVYPYGELFGTEDSDERRQAFLEDFRDVCALAAVLRIHGLVICPPLMPDRQTPFPGSIEALTEMNARILNGLEPIASDQGLRICFEVVGARYSSCRTLAHGREILRRVSGNVGFTVDTYNLYMGCPDDRYEELGELRAEEIGMAHINDADWAPPEELGNQARRCFCGEGALNVDRYLTQLKRTGYDGYLSIETFRPEYWERDAEWVIDAAYRTTRDAMLRNQCL